jgi:hypothetical protein
MPEKSEGWKELALLLFGIHVETVASNLYLYALLMKTDVDLASKILEGNKELREEVSDFRKKLMSLKEDDAEGLAKVFDEIAELSQRYPFHLRLGSRKG